MNFHMKVFNIKFFFKYDDFFLGRRSLLEDVSEDPIDIYIDNLGRRERKAHPHPAKELESLDYDDHERLH